MDADAHAVRDLVDLEPALAADLLVEELAPHALAEHFGAAARQRVEPRLRAARSSTHSAGCLVSRQKKSISTAV